MRSRHRTATAATTIAIALTLAACSAGTQSRPPMLTASQLQSLSAPREEAKPTCPGPSCIYTANNSGNSITGYGEYSNGNIRPQRQIVGPSTGLQSPVGVAVAADGTLYALNDPFGPGPSITIYAPQARGNVQPARTIAGTNTGLNRPSAISLDVNGNIYVLNVGTPSITVYKSTAHGNVPAAHTIMGTKTQLSQYGGQLTAHDTHIYVSGSDSEGNPAVLVFAQSANGDARPTNIITGSATGLDNSDGIAVDAKDNVYVANDGGSSIVAFHGDARNNATPFATIQGSNTGLEGEILGLVVDAKDDVHATCSFFNYQNIFTYAAHANGNVAPIRTIAGMNTGLDYPYGLALQ